jgi:UDP:flavonoid glycosyltransferase YjiC (YdhE family)
VRVALITTGSRGDVQPFVALARALQARRVDVWLAAPGAFAPLAQAYDVAFHPLPVDPVGMLATEVGQRWITSGRDPIAFLRGLRELAEPLGEDLADAMIGACDGADVVVYATLAFPAWHVADARGVPAVQVAFAPTASTAAFPPILFPQPFSHVDPWERSPVAAVARGYHRAAHAVFAEALWLPLRRRINHWRATRLSAPPLGLRSPARDVDRHGEPLLHAFSPTILPPPPDWGPHVTTTGTWFLDRPSAWTPPTDLAAFVGAGDPPVVVGMGSMTTRDPRALTRLVLDALRRAGRRGVLLAGWSGLGGVERDLPHDAFASRDLPHDWLLPRAAAVVHHGGSGTTAAALRAGVPTVVVPHFGDQPLWGDRVHALGAGPAPVPRSDLTADRLAAAIRAAVDDPLIGARAAAVGAAVRAERGVERAVSAILRAGGRGRC